MTTSALSASRPARGRIYHSLFLQVLVAAILGILIGVYAPDFAKGLKIFSDGFLKLITMIVAPIVFCVVVHGIAGAGDLKKVGRLGLIALVYFEVMTTVALILGVALGYLFAPGHGLNRDPRRSTPTRSRPTRPTRGSCRAAGSASSCSTSSRPPCSTRSRATTCCRCCSSPSCSGSRSRWSARPPSRSPSSSRPSRGCCSGSWA